MIVYVPVSHFTAKSIQRTIEKVDTKKCKYIPRRHDYSPQLMTNSFIYNAEAVYKTHEGAQTYIQEYFKVFNEDYIDITTLPETEFEKIMRV